MRKPLVITATGRDQPGIVESITQLMLKYQSNVEASRMARLGGEFAMLMMVSVPEEQFDALREAVRGLREQDYKITTRPTERGGARKYAGYVPYEIVVKGADNEGIIYHIAHYLTEQNINVEKMDTSVVSAPMNGTPLFMMEAIVLVPPSLTFAALQDELDEIGDNLNVDTDITPYVG